MPRSKHRRKPGGKAVAHPGRGKTRELPLSPEDVLWRRFVDGGTRLFHEKDGDSAAGSAGYMLDLIEEGAFVATGSGRSTAGQQGRGVQRVHGAARSRGGDRGPRRVGRRCRVSLSALGFGLRGAGFGSITNSGSCSDGNSGSVGLPRGTEGRSGRLMRPGSACARRRDGRLTTPLRAKVLPPRTASETFASGRSPLRCEWCLHGKLPAPVRSPPRSRRDGTQGRQISQGRTR